MIEASPVSSMTATMESQSPAAAPIRSLRNFAGRMGSGLRAGYETVREMPRSLKTYAAVGATAVTLFTLAHAETALADTTPVAPEGNVPGLTGDTFLSTSPEATASTATTLASTSNLEQECAKDILAQPEILQADMKHPGEVGQGIFIKVLFGGVNAACNPRYKRLASARPQIQDNQNRNVWLNEDGPSWDTIYYSGNKPGAGGHLSFNTFRKPKLYYKPGSGEEVRFKLRLQEEDKKTGKIVKTKIENYPIAVDGQK